MVGPFPPAVYVGRDGAGNNTINAAGYGYILAKYGDNPSLVWFVNGAVTEITVPPSSWYLGAWVAVCRMSRGSTAFPCRTVVPR